MVSITPRVSLMSRAEWDSSGQPRLGYAVDRSARTELIVHHTVAIDSNDASPLIWETDAEVINHMRHLRTIRPDLGLDIPYSFVAFMRPDLTLTICEGRGLDRTGAHTHAHNTSGVATSMAGDFHNYPMGDYLSPFILALNDWFHWQKGQLPNLQVINGHRDYNGTACPGQHLYATKGGWTWEQEQPPQEVDDMKLVTAPNKGAWLIGVTGKRWIDDLTELALYTKLLGTPVVITEQELDSVPNDRTSSIYEILFGNIHDQFPGEAVPGGDNRRLMAIAAWNNKLYHALFDKAPNLPADQEGRRLDLLDKIANKQGIIS